MRHFKGVLSTARNLQNGKEGAKAVSQCVCLLLGDKNEARCFCVRDAYASGYGDRHTGSASTSSPSGAHFLAQLLLISLGSRAGAVV